MYLHDDPGLGVGPHGIGPVADHDAVVDAQHGAHEAEQGAAEDGGDGQLLGRVDVQLCDDGEGQDEEHNVGDAVDGAVDEAGDLEVRAVGEHAGVPGVAGPGHAVDEVEGDFWES